MESPSVRGTNRKWYIAVSANCSRESSTSNGLVIRELLSQTRPSRPPGTDTSLIEIKQWPPSPMHEGHMPMSKDAKRSRRRENVDPAALGVARDLASPGLRATLVWQIVRSLFRLSFAGLMAILAGQ